MSGAPVQNAISFDVEEYFQALNFRNAVKHQSPESRVERGTERILEILSATGVKATFFILGNVAKSHPDLIRKIAKEGHELGSHGISHKTVHELGPELFKKEAKESKALLEDISGQKIAGFRASTFTITRDSLFALSLLLEEGYSYDSSIFPVYHDRYGIPDFPRGPVVVCRSEKGELLEFPPLTLRLPGYNLPCGGGRLFQTFPAFPDKARREADEPVRTTGGIILASLGVRSRPAKNEPRRVEDIQALHEY